MSFINEQHKEINCKIVYCGPAQGGKSTSLRAIYEEARKETKGELISLATGDDRTLFFDFIPLNLGKIKDYTIRWHIYTIPGQAAYDAQRRLITKGADGIVFVADSQIPRMEANLASLRDLQRIFEEEGVEWGSLPTVIQYNKRDTKTAAPLPQLRALLNPTKVPDFETVATSNTGVFDALKAVGTLVMREFRKSA